MPKIRVVAAGVLLLSACVCHAVSWAEDLQAASTVAMQWADDVEGGAEVPMVIVNAQGRARSDLPLLSVVEFAVVLPVGAVVELWTTTPQATMLPWLDERGALGRKVQHWVVDKNTRGFVRLNVTRFVHELSLVGGAETFYVRILGEDGEPIYIKSSDVSSLDLKEVPWRM